MRQIPLDEFPQFPCGGKIESNYSSDAESEQNLLDHLTIDEKKRLSKIEQKTKMQSKSDEWKEERMFRITASNFG